MRNVSGRAMLPDLIVPYFGIGRFDPFGLPYANPIYRIVAVLNIGNHRPAGRC